MSGTMRPMPPAVSDTDEAAERVHLDLLRRSSPGHRLAMALSISATVVGLSRRCLARSHPGLTPDELDLRFVERHYGSQFAGHVQAFLLARRS